MIRIRAARWLAVAATIVVVGSILGAHPAPAGERVTSRTAAQEVGATAASEAVSLFGGTTTTEVGG